MPSTRSKSGNTFRERARHALTLAVLLAGAWIVATAWAEGDQSLLAMGALRPADRTAATSGADSLVAGALSALPEALPFRTGADRKLSHQSEAYRQARKHLPDSFHEYQTRRFIVLSDSKPRWSQDQAALLERTYHQFHRFTRRLGIRPRPVRHKLVCVLFQEYYDYRQFARANDGVTADWISGYYSPKHDRVVFYNIETNPEYAEVMDEVKAGAVLVRGGTERSGAAARSRLRDEYAKAAIATVVHEAVHQLAFHTRIQSPQIQNPLWLSEGLATAFETARARESFGPGRDYRLRKEQFRELLHDDKLIPLRKLVTYAQMPDNDDDTIAAVYHESYALVTWAARYRRTDLRKFMEALRSESPGRPTPQRHLQLFEAAFGDVDRLERLWRRHEMKN